MTTIFVIFPLLIASISASIEHIGPYGYRGPPAPLSNDGRVIETPEVAHARAAHLAAYAVAAQASIRAPPSDSGSDLLLNKDDTSESSDVSSSEPFTSAWDEPAPLGEDGRVVDTTEVSRVKAAHLAAHAEALKNIESPYREAAILWKDNVDVNRLVLVPSHVAFAIHRRNSIYRGPSAPLAPDGAVIDTREVAEARAAHLRAHAVALANTEPINDNCHC
ncbi:uncharacterized protein LOC135163448 [Diachasmimorpha longicaudata]|uniref:uncharacterized protein LOC135163448 n=1 Tax=Diachasmimorpha longicaudata TaxID=58733 RepID=UPI0030B8DAA4